MAWIGRNPGDDVILILFAVLFSLALVASVRDVWLGRLSSSMRTVFKSFQLLLREWKKQDDEVKKLLHQRLLDARLRNFRIMMQGMFFAITPVSVNIAFNILQSGPRVNSFASDIVFVAFNFILVLPVVHPALVARSNHNLISSMLMLLCMAYNLVVADESATQGIMGTNIVMLVLTWVRRTGLRGDTPVLFMLNIAYATTSSVKLGTNPVGCFTDAKTVAATHFLTVLAVFCCAQHLEISYEANMMGWLQLQEVKEMHAAACALLRSCCEVVVELDQDGVISSAAEEFATLLLRGPSSNLQGARLADLLADDDEREAFSARLRNPKLKDLGLAESMLVSMKDAYNTRLRVELLWFEFRRLDGLQYYKVGIRELDCREVLQPNGSSAFTRRQANGVVATVSDGSSLPETASVNSDGLEDPAAWVILDCLDVALPIQALSTEFCMRIGRMPVKAPFVNYLTRPRPFVRWLQSAVNLAQTDRPSEPHTITLKMPQGKVKAQCRIVRSTSSRVGATSAHCAEDVDWEEEDDDVELDMASIMLLLFNVKQRRIEEHSETSRKLSLKGTPITHVCL